MQTIRENIETMKGYIREMSQTFQTSAQKCELIRFSNKKQRRKKSEPKAVHLLFCFGIISALPQNMEKLRMENMSLCQKVFALI